MTLDDSAAPPRPSSVRTGSLSTLLHHLGFVPPPEDPPHLHVHETPTDPLSHVVLHRLALQDEALEDGTYEVVIDSTLPRAR